MMTVKKSRNISYSISLSVHCIILLIMLIVNVELSYTPSDFVEVGFGDIGLSGSSGAPGTEIQDLQQIDDKKSVETVEKEIEKEVELPVVKNTSKDNNINPVEKKDKDKNNNKNFQSKGNQSEGDGSFGYDIEWGGKGKRRIYSYILPSYPSGVEKEIDIRLRFSILPDGTVGTIIPLTKADTKLEDAAINSLRRWKFEPLSKSQKQIEQSAVIVFPYRLD